MSRCTCAGEADIRLPRLFVYSMLGYIDSVLLAFALRDRVRLQGGPSLTTRHLCGVAGGVLTVTPHSTILGMMSKTGCVGAQLHAGMCIVMLCYMCMWSTCTCSACGHHSHVCACVWRASVWRASVWSVWRAICDTTLNGIY